MRARLEAEMTFTANYTFTVNDGGGADACSVALGSYYPNPFITAFDAAITTGSGVSATVTVDDGDGGTGIVTITLGVAASIVFPSLDAARVLGFASTTLASATTHVGTLGMLGMWLPDCPMSGPDLDLDSTGCVRSDAGYSVGPTGIAAVYVGTSYKSFRGLRWSHVSRRKAIECGASPLSWEAFVTECQWGGSYAFPVSAGGAAPTVLIYVDATNDTLLGAASSGDGEYRLVLSPEVALGMPAEGWTGVRTVEIAEAIKV